MEMVLPKEENILSLDCYVNGNILVRLMTDEQLTTLATALENEIFKELEQKKEPKKKRKRCH